MGDVPVDAVKYGQTAALGVAPCARLP